MRYLRLFYVDNKEQGMSVKIISEDGKELTIQIKVDLSGSMLEAEEKIEAICNAVGSLSTEKALEYFDTDGTPLKVGEKKIHDKGKRK
jgi:hypothetical protein